MKSTTIAIATSLLAAFGTSAALANPTLTKSEWEMAQEQKFHQSTPGQAMRQEAAAPRAMDHSARTQADTPFTWNP